MLKGWPFGRAHPADEGLTLDEVRALESERLFPASTIRKRGRDARRAGSEARARGYQTFGRRVRHDPVREDLLRNRFFRGGR